MDRYQFEGYISDYLENSLSIAKRKEFEQYMLEHTTAKDQVEAIRSTVRQLNGLSKVKTNPLFMDKLQSRIANQSEVMPVSQEKRKPLLFGFTPLTATMMSLVVLAIVFVGYELMPDGSASPVAIPAQMTTNSMVPTPTTSAPISQVNAAPMVVATEDDSTVIEEDLKQISPALEDKINYVKTQ